MSETSPVHCGAVLQGPSWSKVPFMWRCCTKDFLPDRCVPLLVECTKTAVKLKFASWGHNKKWSFTNIALWTTMALLSNGEIWRLGFGTPYLLLLRWKHSLLCFPRQYFLPLKSKSYSGLQWFICILLFKANMTWFPVSGERKIKQNKMKPMLTRPFGLKNLTSKKTQNSSWVFFKNTL